MLRMFDLCYLCVKFIINMLRAGVKTILFTYLIMISFAGESQGRLDELLATTRANEAFVNNAKLEVERIIQPLLTSHSSDQKLLRAAFHRMHTNFLKKYEPYADFNQVFETGTYDCLTATALLSQLLERLNFRYEIIETNYHIFLIVQTSHGEVLLETTDRWGGFVTDKDAIAKRIGDYRSNLLASNDSDKKYQYSFKLYQAISPEKLTGLLYFNQAVKAFNKHEWINCASLLETSYKLYESPRCVELGSVLIRTVTENSSEEKTKEACLTHLKHLWIKRAESVAAY
ncbi:hypothetical protein BH09BAC3_BH09BAC3_16940 [soil metagenome]